MKNYDHEKQLFCRNRGTKFNVSDLVDIMPNIDENDISTWPGAPSDVLRFIENEASDLYASADIVAEEIGME